MHDSVKDLYNLLDEYKRKKKKPFNTSKIYLLNLLLERIDR